MQYEYTAKSIAGETLTGLLAADSTADAGHRLRERDLFVMSLKPAGRGRSLLQSSGGRPGRKKITKRDLMTLTSQLAIMTRAGVDLATALNNASEQCPNLALKRAIQQIHEDVLAGKSVSAAMGDYRHVFGQSYVAGVAAAEAAGRLPEVLDRLAGLLRADLRMRGTLRTLLAYPILLASVSGLVVFALVFFVLPQFAGVFAQLDLTLPLITRVLIGVAMEVRGRFWLWGTLLFGAIAGLVACIVSGAGREYYDRALLNLVLVRNVTRPLFMGRAFRLLGTMIESGVPLLEGLRLTRSATRNCLMRSLFDTLEVAVTNGRGLSETFLASSFVPPAAAQMIATAEDTGTLSSVTQLMGEFYEEEGETRLRELAAILEPLIIIGMGIIVAVVVMSVMLPVFDFATAAK